jgi:hypothetical protein
MNTLLWMVLMALSLPELIPFSWKEKRENCVEELKSFFVGGRKSFHQHSPLEGGQGGVARIDKSVSARDEDWTRCNDTPLTPLKGGIVAAELPYSIKPQMSLQASTKPQTHSQTKRGIWISAEEISRLPTSGAAWENVLAAAQQPVVAPNIFDQNDASNVLVLAKALVFARVREEKYRAEAVAALRAMIATQAPNDARTLALGRELPAYVIAADLIDLRTHEPELDQQFRTKLVALRSQTFAKRTLISTHEQRVNNWGTHAGASRAAIAAYLNDEAELQRCAQVFRGWLGEREAYASFKFGKLSWQADSTKPVAINAKGAHHNGHSLDGALPEELRRAGTFTWPPPKENYVYEALQGALAQAVILHRAGYDVWEWGDRALLRAFEWLYREANFPATGDDAWQAHVINHFYRAQFPATTPCEAGKNVGYTDWTHGSK